jgi:TRAP transporter 4TM/12TM fusion protein
MTADRAATLVVRVAAVTLSLFHIYTGYAGTFYPYVQRAVPVLLSVVIILLTIRAWTQPELPDAAGKTGKPNRAPLYDWVLAIAALPAFGYIAIFPEYLTERWPLTPSFAPTPLELGLGALAIVLLLEACRRVMGPVLVIVACLALAYAYLGEHFPWKLLAHRGFTVPQILDHMYLTLEGIWGSALAVAATYIVLFVVFSAFAERAGMSMLLIEMSSAIAGHLRGGPAKVAIFSSGLVGSITGSTVANVYTTGQFTIPMMKRTGFRPSTAGAVEALASNGGQIMPPVLGATAFILAAYAGVPYTQVALASLIPALVYYAGLYWYIHLEASKQGLVGLPRDEVPSLIGVLRKGGHLLLPLVVLIGLFIYGFSPVRAAFFAIVATIPISWLRRETRLGPKEILEALEKGGREATMIIVICAVVGFVIGTFTLTGLGLNITSAIVNLAGGNFVLLLLMVFFACLVLGTGMNTVAAFLLVSIVAVPALKMQGVSLFVGNMFVFYASLLSHITPPVCLAVFAAASIAKASSWATAYEGLRMGVIAYLLPFIIVFYPSLLLLGTPLQVVVDTLTIAAGVMAISSGIQGWLFLPIGIAERIWAIAAGLLLLWPSVPSTAAGGTMVALLLALSALRWRRHSMASGPPPHGAAILPSSGEIERGDGEQTLRLDATKG